LRIFHRKFDAEQGDRFIEWKRQIQEENIEIIGEINCSCELSQDLGWGITLVPQNNFLYDNLKSIISKIST